MSRLPDLEIGDISINPPIIQGGMGVQISLSNLASAVSDTGALGVIASVGIGPEADLEEDFVKTSSDHLRRHILLAKEKTTNPIGVNIMVALTNYDSLVNTCVEGGVDVIISGAGLPLRLPQLTLNSNVKLVPIVSSGRAANIICTNWLRKYNRLPDAVVVEGPLAGGHLGFSRDELSQDDLTLEKIVSDVLNVVASYDKPIPVIAAGGIWDGKDIARFLKMGAGGVQMATRFVCTYECDASQAYKDAFLRSKPEDIIIIDSPVGLPGRVIKNGFVERVLSGEKIKFRCPYRCLKTCDYASVNYCIADALVNSSKGDMENGFAMCGQNAWKMDKMVRVKDIIDELVEEAERQFL